jgi:carboxyl-terminal processing protease
VVLFFAVCAVAGSVLQRKVGAQSSADESQLRDSLKSFTNVYALVEQNYAEPIERRQGRHGHLRRGDSRHVARARPALQLLRSQGLRPMREEQHGRYYGVGMTIQQQNGKVYVVYPFEGARVQGRHPSRRRDLLGRRQAGLVDGKNPDG